MYYWVVQTTNDRTAYYGKESAIKAIRAYLSVADDISNEEVVEKFTTSAGCALEHHWSA